jgi:predicted SAM-dependent methyltransferase
MYLETISEIFMDYYGDEKLDCTEDIKNDIIKNKVNIENYTKEIIEIIENIKI